MSKRVLTHSILCLAVATGLACRSKPVPHVATAGKSMTVVLTAEAGAAEGYHPWANEDVGFGGEWYWDRQLEDVQRGEIEFFLVDGANEVPLRTLLATRVFADPASDAGMYGASHPMLGNWGMGSVLAVVHIPADVDDDHGGVLDLPGEFPLRARKVLRASKQDPNPVPLGYDLIYDEVIEVLPPELDQGEPQDTENLPYLHLLPGYSTTNPALTQQLYPHPKLLVKLPGSPVPSAGHLEINVPAASVLEVRGVFEEQHYGRRSIVLFDPNVNPITIDFMNLEPPPRVAKLAIVFEPGNDYVRVDGDTVEIKDYFTVHSTQLWDENGDLITEDPNDVSFIGIR